MPHSPQYPKWVKDLYTIATTTVVVDTEQKSLGTATSNMTTVSLLVTPPKLPSNQSDLAPRASTQNFSDNSERPITSRERSSGVATVPSSDVGPNPIEQFIIDNFSEVSESKFPREEAQTKNYYFIAVKINLTEDQMIALIKVMIEYQYDGAMHTENFLPSKKNIATQWLDSFYAALKQNLNPAALGYQVLNVLPVTAVLTAMWEADPSYRPSPLVFTGLGLVSLAIIRNNHFYASAISSMSKEDIQTLSQEITNAHNTLLEKLKTVFPREIENEIHIREKLLRILTTSSVGKRVDQEIRAYVALLVKMSEAFALVYSDVFKTLPAYMKPFLGILFGVIQGGDMAFSVVTRIGGQHRGFIEFKNGIIPTVNTSDLAYFFPRFANFAPIPWIMAKIGPVMWVLVRARAAMAELTLLGVNSEQLRGALWGYYVAAGIVDMFASEVFSRYTVDENLAKHLETPRDFLYETGTQLNRVGQASLGSLPLGAGAAYAAHLAGLGILHSAALGGLTTLFPIVLLFSSENYRNLHSSIFEFRFVNAAFKQLDRLHFADKLLLTIASTGLSVFGLTRENPIAATAGLTMLFLSGTSLVVERSRSAANVMRFMFGQMLLYSAAFLTWVLNCVLPMMNIMRGQSANDHPNYLDPDYFSKTVVIILGAIGLFLGALGARADAKSTLEKVSKLTTPINSEEKGKFSLSRAITACRNWRDSDEKDDFSKRFLVTYHAS